MEQIKKTSRKWKWLSILSQAGLMAVAIIGFVMPVTAAPPLPREPMPKPTLPGTYQGVPRPPVHIGTRPKFNPSNIGVLPDLKIVRVTTRINSRVMDICRSGRKDRPQSSIEVLNFDLLVKNVGRGTAYMNRDGVIVSAQTMDFPERVFDTSKYYLGGRGGPGHFIGPHGRQNWILKSMAQVKPGKIFKATSHLGIGYNNKIFTVNRLSELAGQTHRFRIKLTSYGRPGLKESNTRNNEYIVSYTFPRNFCKATIQGGVSQTTPTLKPHLLIQRVRLNLRRPYECRTDGPTFADGVLVIKNTGGNFVPKPGGDVFNVDGQIAVAQNRLNLRSVGYLRSSIPAGATRQVRFRMTGTAGLLNTPTPSMSSLAGRTVSLRVSFFDIMNIVSGDLNSRIRFPSDFCASRVVGGMSAPIGRGQTVKSNISGFQFARGKNCVSPGGRFTIKGSAFGNSVGGRTVELGGNGQGVNLAIKSWSSRTIRVQLPRAARLQYRKNYWVRILAPAVAGAARTLSNLKLGVVLCPPTVHVGGSGSSGTQSAGQQNGGRGINVTTGLPDLIISRLSIANPVPDCFAYNDGSGNKKNYKLASMSTTIILKNIGPVAYSTRDGSRNKQLSIGIIGDRFVGRPDRHGLSLCAVPISNIRLSNLNIPAGGSKTIRTKLNIEICKVPRKGAVKKRTYRLPGALVNTLLGRSRSIEIGIGKAIFIKNKIPVESNYRNNSRRTLFRFPNRICNGR